MNVYCRNGLWRAIGEWIKDRYGYTHRERERERERDDQISMRWCWLYCNTLVMYPYWVNWFSQHANINEGKKYIYWYSIHTIISY